MLVEPTCVRELYADPDFEMMVTEYSLHANKKFPKPRYRQADYQKMEDAGVLNSWRVIVAEKLVGFITVMNSNPLHFGCAIGVVESLFVLKAHRFTGAGVKMFETVEQFSRSTGLNVLVVQCPFASKLKLLLEKRGYTPEIICYCLAL